MVSSFFSFITYCAETVKLETIQPTVGSIDIKNKIRRTSCHPIIRRGGERKKKPCLIIHHYKEVPEENSSRLFSFFFDLWTC